MLTCNVSSVGFVFLLPILTPQLTSDLSRFLGPSVDFITTHRCDGYSQLVPEVPWLLAFGPLFARVWSEDLIKTQKQEAFRRFL